MTEVVKKGMWMVAAGFAAFYLLSQPRDAADAIQTTFQTALDASEQILTFVVHQIVTFFEALTS
jgi:hypothetical protein